MWENFKTMLKFSWVGLHDIVFAPFLPYPGSELHESMVKDGRLPPLSEEYFLNLTIYSDLSQAQSFNPRFSNWQVLVVRLLFLGTFYFSSYLFRPQRFFLNFYHIFQTTPHTRGEQVVIQLINKQFKIHKDRSTCSV